MVTRQPCRAAAWMANPPHPVPISITLSSGPKLQLGGDHLELGHLGLLRGWCRRRRRTRRNTPLSGRASGRRIRWRGRSGRRCSRGPGACSVAGGAAPPPPAPRTARRRVQESPQSGGAAQGDAHDGGEVVGVPPPGDVALGHAARAAAQNGGPGPLVVHHDGRHRVARPADHGPAPRACRRPRSAGSRGGRERRAAPGRGRGARSAGASGRAPVVAPSVGGPAGRARPVPDRGAGGSGAAGTTSRSAWA